jgi:shikimate dehydrogenase
MISFMRSTPPGQLMINKDTKLCISLASKPSNFGTTLHNAGYASLGLNFLYKPIGISNVEGAITGVRALGIRGCSVSMPFKETVIPFLDSLDESAAAIGAVNTIVNEKGSLTGYNTDATGAQMALQSIQIDPKESVLLLGAGGVARAVLFALKKLGFQKVMISNRSEGKVGRLKTILDCDSVAWSSRENIPVSLIINATSIGMTPDGDSMSLTESFLQKARAVMDVVLTPMETRLICSARSAGKSVAPGYLMSLHQAARQFQIYTNKTAPMDVFESELQKMLIT